MDAGLYTARVKNKINPCTHRYIVLTISVHRHEQEGFIREGHRQRGFEQRSKNKTKQKKSTFALR